MSSLKLQCPSCSQYKFVSKRLYFILIGLGTTGCFIWLLVIPPLGIVGIIIGLIITFAGILSKGRICTNCRYDD